MSEFYVFRCLPSARLWVNCRWGVTDDERFTVADLCSDWFRASKGS